MVVESSYQLKTVVSNCEQLEGRLRAVGSGKKRLGVVVSGCEWWRVVESGCI